MNSKNVEDKDDKKGCLKIAPYVIVIVFILYMFGSVSVPIEKALDDMPWFISVIVSLSIIFVLAKMFGR